MFFSKRHIPWKYFLSTQKDIFFENTFWVLYYKFALLLKRVFVFLIIVRRNVRILEVLYEYLISRFLDPWRYAIFKQILLEIVHQVLIVENYNSLKSRIAAESKVSRAESWTISNMLFLFATRKGRCYPKY